MNMPKNKPFFSYLLLLFGSFLFTAFMFIINLFHFNYNLNADLASEVILAKLIWGSGEIVPQSWFTSSELRIISTPNISALFYGLTHNALLSAGLGCCFMTTGIILSIYFFMNTIEIRKTYKLLMIFLCLMLPCSLVSLELLYLFASYYAIHVIVLFLALGFYNSGLKAKSINRFIYILLVIFAFILGLQGVRGILIIWGPLLCVEVLRNITAFIKTRVFNKSDQKLLVLITLLPALSFVGTLFPFSVEQNISRNIRKGFEKLIFTVIPDVSLAIGFPYTNLAGKIILGILCLITIIILFDLLRKLFKQKELAAFEWSYLVLAISPILTIIMVAFSTVESTERYYFILHFTIAMSIVLLIKKAGNIS